MFLFRPNKVVNDHIKVEKAIRRFRTPLSFRLDLGERYERLDAHHAEVEERGGRFQIKGR